MRRCARQFSLQFRIELLRELHAQPLIAAPHRRLHGIEHLIERHVLMRERIERGARTLSSKREND